MKILIHSNGPHVPSGYGKQARLAGRILRELGHEVTFSCFSGLWGQPMVWDGYTLLPAGNEMFGTDTILRHAQFVGADVIIPLMDLWKLEPIARQFADIPCITAPLFVTDCIANDGGPGMLDRSVLEKMGTEKRRVAAVSEFGQARLKAIGIEAPVVPHCYDGSIFRRFSRAERDQLREENGTKDHFVIGICAANNDTMRKGFPEQFAAFREFSTTFPEARLSMFAVTNTSRGHNLPELAYDMGIFDKVMWMDDYMQISGMLPDQLMAAWYNSIDVLSLCSYGEGFGVPVIEAQACGTPVVASECSALMELVRPAGFLVETERFWNPVHRAWWMRPDIDDIVRAWTEVYGDLAHGWVEREEITGSVSRYEAAAVRDDAWAPFLKTLEEK